MALPFLKNKSERIVRAGLALATAFICLFSAQAYAEMGLFSTKGIKYAQKTSETPTTPAPSNDQGTADVESETTEEPQNGDAAIPAEKIVEAAPKIQFDLEKLPFPTRKMRQLIYDAAKTGDIEKLRPYIGYGDDVTMLSLGGYDEDPIEFLKSISGDPLGQELLAILTEILEAGYVLIDEGTERETYVWPYFYAHSLQDLTPEQKVQLYRIITFGDYQDMESFGSYIFYRLGISPEGRWRFFVAGD